MPSVSFIHYFIHCTLLLISWKMVTIKQVRKKILVLKNGCIHLMVKCKFVIQGTLELSPFEQIFHDRLGIGHS